jgi:hypothetical protein
MTIYLFVVLVAAVLSVIANAITDRFLIACLVSTALPVIPIVSMGWHHVQHWYYEPVQFAALGLVSAATAGGAVHIFKSRRSKATNKN